MRSVLLDNCADLANQRREMPLGSPPKRRKKKRARRRPSAVVDYDQIEPACWWSPCFSSCVVRTVIKAEEPRLDKDLALPASARPTRSNSRRTSKEKPYPGAYSPVVNRRDKGVSLASEATMEADDASVSTLEDDVIS